MYTHILSDEEGNLWYVHAKDMDTQKVLEGLRKLKDEVVTHMVFRGQLFPIEDDGASYHDQS